MRKLKLRKLNNLPKVTETVSNKARIQTQAVWPQRICPYLQYCAISMFYDLGLEKSFLT